MSLSIEGIKLDARQTSRRRSRRSIFHRIFHGNDICLLSFLTGARARALFSSRIRAPTPIHPALDAGSRSELLARASTVCVLRRWSFLGVVRAIGCDASVTTQASPHDQSAGFPATPLFRDGQSRRGGTRVRKDNATAEWDRGRFLDRRSRRDPAGNVPPLWAFFPFVIRVSGP